MRPPLSFNHPAIHPFNPSQPFSHPLPAIHTHSHTPPSLSHSASQSAGQSASQSYPSLPQSVPFLSSYRLLALPSLLAGRVPSLPPILVFSFFFLRFRSSAVNDGLLGLVCAFPGFEFVQIFFSHGLKDDRIGFTATPFLKGTSTPSVAANFRGFFFLKVSMFGISRRYSKL